MKVTLLLAQGGCEALKKSTEMIISVLKELEVELNQIELVQLPYYKGERSTTMNQIMTSIKESDGVIAISFIAMLGLQGAMQSFFDQATLYEQHFFDKPILAVTYSEWLGEQEACQMIQKYWNILGGTNGGSIYMNKSCVSPTYLKRLEKEIENFYRFMKQDRVNIDSTERRIYYSTKKNIPQVKDFIEVIKQQPPIIEHIEQEKVSSKEVKEYAETLSGKEKVIQNITHLIEKEVSTEQFVEMKSGVYTRNFQNAPLNKESKKLQQIPHYFVAQHDKTLQAITKYIITDSNEEGYIIIKDGDCFYEKTIDQPPTVEIILSESVLQELLTGKITYQKSFMLGKLKIRGNFSILPRLDQAFKTL